MEAPVYRMRLIMVRESLRIMQLLKLSVQRRAVILQESAEADATPPCVRHPAAMHRYWIMHM